MRLREQIQRMMYGRYGNDQLGMFCFGLYVMFWIVSLGFRGTFFGRILSVADYVFVIIYFFRFFSRNIYQRQRENQKFLSVRNQVKNYFKFLRLRYQERSGTKKLYRCPKCHQMIRVPRGRGRIEITCPKCHFAFIKKT